MKRLLVLALVTACGVAWPEVMPSRSTYSQTPAFVRPNYWTHTTITPFDNSDKRMSFSLVTSWIPGNGHTGTIRIRMTGRPVDLTLEQQSHEMNVPDAMEKFVERTGTCSYDLVLYDNNGFVLREVESMPFTVSVDEASTPVGLVASSSGQMDSSEYKQLVEGGSWNLKWSCPRINTFTN